jgi:hypothetical protein
MKIDISKINQKLTYGEIVDGWAICYKSNLLQVMDSTYIIKIYKYHKEEYYKAYLSNINCNYFTGEIFVGNCKTIGECYLTIEEAKENVLIFLKNQIDIINGFVTEN